MDRTPDHGYAPMMRSTRSMTAGRYQGTGRSPVSHDCHALHAVGDGLPATAITSFCVRPRRFLQFLMSAERTKLCLGGVDAVKQLIDSVHVSVRPNTLTVNPIDFVCRVADHFFEVLAPCVHDFVSRRLELFRAAPLASILMIYARTVCVKG